MAATNLIFLGGGELPDVSEEDDGVGMTWGVEGLRLERAGDASSLC